MKKVIAIASIVAFTLTSSTAFANGHKGSSNDIEVSNYNSATVVNTVVSGASTGSNYAGGADGGKGGNGGDIEAGKVKNSSTGNGGAGGDAGAGGVVITGDASSEVGILNTVNSNSTTVKDDCGCVGRKKNKGGDIEAKNKNNASVGNTVVSASDTGNNTAKGADGGNGGNAGDIEAKWGKKVNGSATGNGGSGGDADENSGGYVQTGAASSKVGVINVVNTNLIRIKKGSN